MFLFHGGIHVKKTQRVSQLKKLRKKKKNKKKNIFFPGDSPPYLPTQNYLLPQRDSKGNMPQFTAFFRNKRVIFSQATWSFQAWREAANPTTCLFWWTDFFDQKQKKHVFFWPQRFSDGKDHKHISPAKLARGMSIRFQGLGCPWKLVTIVSKLVYFTYLRDEINLLIGIRINLLPSYQVPYTFQ